MELPNDPAILLGVVNTKLRDDYRDLDDLCKSMGVEQEYLTRKLGWLHYTYHTESNQFRCC